MGNLLSACLSPSTSQEEEERHKQQQQQQYQQQHYQQQHYQQQQYQQQQYQQQQYQQQHYQQDQYQQQQYPQQHHQQQNQQQHYQQQNQQGQYQQQHYQQQNEQGQYQQDQYQQQQHQQQQYQQQYPQHYPPYQQPYGAQTGPPPWQELQPAAPYSYAAAAAHAGVGSQGPVAAVARDLLQFETTGQVPEGLSGGVKASKGTQALWFQKLLEAWKARWPPPGSPSELAAFIRSTLNTIPSKELHGLLAYYDLLNLSPEAQLDPTPHFPPPVSHVPPPHATHLPAGVKYEFYTMPVDGKAIADGDTVTVYVDVSRDPREDAVVPPAIRTSVEERQRARAVRDFRTADRLQREISDAGYRVFDEGGVLAKKYRIRSRGIDAPESKQQYGPEAGAAFRALVEGRNLRVLIYTTDQYGRSVADMYCGNTFVQEYMLRNGFAWHYSTYDHRPEFAQWMAEASQARRGLWADPSVQEPWNWRKEHPRGG